MKKSTKIIITVIVVIVLFFINAAISGLREAGMGNVAAIVRFLSILGFLGGMGAIWHKKSE
ncbi:MAG: hypothetical protein LKM33_05060 [Bacteroidales bacterium]|jgi:hypothetical protein|nr:hypothetical protein [Bacteroidales bacterium]